VASSKKDWSIKLDKALWAYKTAYKTPFAFSPFQLIYGKACHLLVKLEHKTYWELKMLDLDAKVVGEEKTSNSKT